VLLASSQLAKTQPKISSRNTIYADFLSRDVYYSINYDRMFSQGKKIYKSYRVGFSAFSNIIALPVGINFFSGHANNHFEFGVTFVPYVEDYQKLFSPVTCLTKNLTSFRAPVIATQKRLVDFFLESLQLL